MKNIFLLFIFIFLFKVSFSQQYKQFERHYQKGYYWSKHEAKRNLKKFLFSNDVKKGDVIADIGAYNGFTELALSMFHEDLTFYLQETQADRLNKCGFYEIYNYYTKENGKPITNKFNFVIGDRDHCSLPDSTFDKIIFINVFEYISRCDLYLKDLRTKLKRNGKVYVQTTNKFKDSYFIKIFEANGFSCERSVKKGGYKQLVFVASQKSKNAISDIFDAAIQKDYDKTKFFLESKVDVNSTLDAVTLLEAAGSISDNQKILKLLIDKGANINSSELFVETPLGKFAPAGEYETVKLLLDNGALPTYASLDMSVWFAHDVRIVKLLVDKGAKVYDKPNATNYILFHAAQGGDLETIKYLLSLPESIDINKKNDLGESFILWAAYSYNVQVMKYLLDEKQFNLNEKDNDGMTVLMHAVYGGSIEMIKYLVAEKKVNVNEKNKEGFTALHFAFDPEISKYLVSQGAI